MRIGVIGAGAIGGTLAALLDRAGEQVVVTARGAQLDAIRERGLTLTGAWGDHVARIGAAQVLPEPPDLAVLTVKAQDAAAAAAAHVTLLAGVPVVVVQNGLAGPQALRSILPDSPLIGGLSMIAAAFLEPGVVTVTAAKTTVLAADTAGETELRAAAGVLRRAVPITTAPDLVGAQWSKLVVNQLNAAPALTGLAGQQALASPRLRTAIASAMRETVRVGRAAGVHFSGLPGVTPSVLRMLTVLPPELSGRIVAARLVAGMGPVLNLGSTLQSIRRGVPTEIDHLSGAVAREGDRLGVPTPVNHRIVDLVHEVADTGRFLSPDDAAALLLR
ncbi:ketopantoate reductase family protein [uncultured Amnibacterium sp.]|uniref:ketopantoate reductase family protein n=1 Tax=uncultured Amnibacterium sp. TaxID=1631851 RepID=UPI0035CB29B1